MARDLRSDRDPSDIRRRIFAENVEGSQRRYQKG
jgi:hypothetical protein